MLNTILDLAEADAGALQLRKELIDLSVLVRQLIDLYQPAMDMHNHQVIARLQPIKVKADLSLLNRAIANLLDNEIAHLPSNRHISISLSGHDGDAEIVIEDNGPGFPSVLREHAFERFVKGEQSTGHGLGLAFVDAVAQAHGGSVRICDRSGGGVMIVFSLPTAEVLNVEQNRVQPNGAKESMVND